MYSAQRRYNCPSGELSLPLRQHLQSSISTGQNKGTKPSRYKSTTARVSQYSLPFRFFTSSRDTVLAEATLRVPAVQCRLCTCTCHPTPAAASGWGASRCASKAPQLNQAAGHIQSSMSNSDELSGNRENPHQESCFWLIAKDCEARFFRRAMP